MNLPTLARVLQAASFAARKHAGQFRKDAATPYVNHVIEVADILATVGRVTDVNVLVAALLHDILEDTNTTAVELEEGFGADVRELVLEVTDDKSLSRDVRRRLQIERAPYISARAKQIRIADKISNLRSLLLAPSRDWAFSDRRAYCERAGQMFLYMQGVNENLDAEFRRVHAGGQRLCSLPLSGDGTAQASAPLQNGI